MGVGDEDLAPLRLVRAATLLGLVVLGIVLGGCNPVYVFRAGWAQAQILAAREPLVDVMTDPATDADTRGKLRLAHDARAFAIEELGFRNAGDAYTSFARLPSDTLALILSAAYRDRLAFRTWWFPIAGRVPYRAYFSERSAFRARDALDAEGYDTYLRPTAAFSTLGWFSDPVYSTLLRQDEVGVATSILHELSHNHLYVPGHGRFNESFSSFAGYTAAIEFFCRREGGGADTVKCDRARDRWFDARTVSRYLMALETEIRGVYGRGDLDVDEKIERRDVVYAEALERFRGTVQPELRASSYAYLAAEELNNATFLARTLYFHRLDDFHRLWEEGWDGDLAGLLAWIRAEAPRRADPFEVLDAAVAGPGRAGEPRGPGAAERRAHPLPVRNGSPFGR